MTGDAKLGSEKLSVRLALPGELESSETFTSSLKGRIQSNRNPIVKMEREGFRAIPRGKLPGVIAPSKRLIVWNYEPFSCKEFELIDKEVSEALFYASAILIPYSLKYGHMKLRAGKLVSL